MTGDEERTGQPAPLPSPGAVDCGAARLLRWTLVAIAFLGASGVVAGWFDFAGRDRDAPLALVRLFDLNAEANVPTWLSTLLLACASLAMIAVGAAHRAHGVRGAGHWTVLGGVFAFLSVDEAAQVHELVMQTMDEQMVTSGALAFAWVIPYGLATMVLAAVYLRFWWRLPPRTRRLLGLSAACFVGGALGFELLEGLWQTYRGWGRGMRVLFVIEECLEMTGVALCVYAVVSYWAREFQLCVRRQPKFKPQSGQRVPVVANAAPHAGHVACEESKSTVIEAAARSTSVSPRL